MVLYANLEGFHQSVCSVGGFVGFAAEAKRFPSVRNDSIHPGVVIFSSEGVVPEREPWLLPFPQLVRWMACTQSLNMVIKYGYTVHLNQREQHLFYFSHNCTKRLYSCSCFGKYITSWLYGVQWATYIDLGSCPTMHFVWEEIILQIFSISREVSPPYKM